MQILSKKRSKKEVNIEGYMEEEESVKKPVREDS